MSQLLREQGNACAMRAAPSSRCCHPIPCRQAIPGPGQQGWAMEPAAGADGAEGLHSSCESTAPLSPVRGGFLLMPKPDQSLSPGARAV